MEHGSLHIRLIVENLFFNDLSSAGLERLVLCFFLDVIGDRLLAPTEAFFVCGEGDRLAFATMHLLRRDVLGIDVLEPWIARLAAGAVGRGSVDRNPYMVAGNVQNYLRSLHLQLSLGTAASGHPAVRSDLLLVLAEKLRATNPAYFGRSAAH